MDVINNNNTVRMAGVHSIDYFELNVDSLIVAKKFYEDFGLNVTEVEQHLELQTDNCSHVWAYLYQAEKKQLRKLVFGAYAEDIDKLIDQVEYAGAVTTVFQDALGKKAFHFTDPDGLHVEVIINHKVTPSKKNIAPHSEQVLGQPAAPSRRHAKRVRPTRLSHVLLFSSNLQGSVNFYEQALGLRLSDCSKDAVAFMHAIHGADHHLLAFVQSKGTGLHHCSWTVESIDDIGLGAQFMHDHGWQRGWGIGRHVLGSNYFYYVRDPWGSYSEYSYDIDFIPAEIQWISKQHPPEDALYLWGPEVPEDFVTNYEM